MSTAFEGKRCLVTGATNPGSVGFACAALLLDAKGTVTIMGRDADKVTAAVAKLRSENAGGVDSRVHGVVGDLKKPQDMKGVVEGSATAMGGLDVVVISGGNGGREYMGMDDTDPNSYHVHYDVAVTSSLILTETAIPFFKAAGGGSVVMVSSMAATVPWPSTAPYNLAKAAQNALVRNLAFKYSANKIRINAVLPACIHTERLDVMAKFKGVPVEEYAALRAKAHPMNYCGSPSEVGQAVVYLASPQASYITGELLKVDGGLDLSSWWNLPHLTQQYVPVTK